ncbi:PREDICTED: uncharacterized protein LOC109165846 [Ipomoea nil]|uniref:uncharacterized protein LOC109165846 n=1 Tax=Ipomoea nil TaxID=35883 RepID=UPI0009014693|nr:PREDICTED: uncharacterized protein LOC109165846 [Ipomoea nil]
MVVIVRAGFNLAFFSGGTGSAPAHHLMEEPIMDIFHIRWSGLPNDPIILNNSSTIFVVPNVHTTTSWTIRPYARKGDEYALRRVRNLTIAEVHLFNQRIRRCTTKYDVPTGGFAENLFTDLIIPLYLTSWEFDGEVQFLVTDDKRRPRWTNKFKEVLQRLSRYEIVDFDNREKDGENVVLCFPRIIVGLKANKEFSINVVSSDHIYMKNFMAFLRNAYDLKRDNIIAKEKLQPPSPSRLLVIARNKTRRLERR